MAWKRNKGIQGNRDNISRFECHKYGNQYYCAKWKNWYDQRCRCENVYEVRSENFERNKESSRLVYKSLITTEFRKRKITPISYEYDKLISQLEEVYKGLPESERKLSYLIKERD